MRDFSIDLIWAKIQIAFTALGGWLGYFLGGTDGLLIALLLSLPVVCGTDGYRPGLPYTQTEEGDGEMTPKEYLNQAFHLDQRINSKLDMLATLKEMATKTTSIMQDDVVSHESREQNGQVAQGTDDDPRRVFLQLHFYADDRNVLKDVVWWRWSRRKTCSCCMVCVFPSHRSSGI